MREKQIERRYFQSSIDDAIDVGDVQVMKTFNEYCYSQIEIIEKIISPSKFLIIQIRLFEPTPQHTKKKYGETRIFLKNWTMVTD